MANENVSVLSRVRCTICLYAVTCSFAHTSVSQLGVCWPSMQTVAKGEFLMLLSQQMYGAWPRIRPVLMAFETLCI